MIIIFAIVQSTVSGLLKDSNTTVGVKKSPAMGLELPTLGIQGRRLHHSSTLVKNSLNFNSQHRNWFLDPVNIKKISQNNYRLPSSVLGNALYVLFPFSRKTLHLTIYYCTCQKKINFLLIYTTYSDILGCFPRIVCPGLETI